MSAARPRLAVAMTGASGAIYGIRAVQLLRESGLAEVHLMVTRSARRTIAEETDMSLSDLMSQADHVHDERDIGASLASGSFRTLGLLVAPCSVKTLSAIANCYDNDLVVRTADVCLKERRRVVLMLRETPFHAGHIELMAAATRSGAIVMPPVPAFYHRPRSMGEVVDQTVCRALDLFGLEMPQARRWAGSAERLRARS